MHPQDWVREARKRYVVSERRVTACGRREFAVPTAWGQKGRHLRFLPSLNTRFPCWDSLGADGRLRKQEKGNGSRVTLACLSPPFRSSQTAYCYTCGLINAERGMTVPRNIFTCADYPNPAVIADLHSQTVCATLLSPRGPSLALWAIHLVSRLRRLSGLCSRTVSDTANRLRKTRKKKSSAVPLFRSGHM